MLHSEPSIEETNPHAAKISVRTQLIVFFILSFLIAWLAWLPMVLNPKLPQPFSILGLFAPAISATLVAWWAQGKVGLITLYKRYTIWRFSIGWYLLTLLIMPIIYAISLTITIFSTHASLANLFFTSSPFFLFIAYIYLMVLNSGEEIGWRGFALPLLQSRLHSPLLSGFLLGVLWALWHLPLYIYPDLATLPYPLFFLLAVGLSLIYTYLFNRTKGSLLTAVMLHAATDWLPRVVQLTHVGLQFWIIVIILVWVLAVLMLMRPGMVGSKPSDVQESHKSHS